MLGKPSELERSTASARHAPESLRDVAPADYFTRLLRLIQQALSPVSATAWGVDQDGVLSVIAELADARPSCSDSASALAHANRVLDALTAGLPRVHTLDPSGSRGKRAADIEILVPFGDGERRHGVLELVIAQSDTGPGSVDRAVAAAQEFAAYASSFISSLQATPVRRGTRQFADDLNQVTLALHSEVSVTNVAMTAVNEGHLLLGFDRLSLAVPGNRRATLAAVSGQERIEPRTNLVRTMVRLASLALEAKKPIRFDGDAGSLPPQVRDAVLQYVNESGARCLEAILLRPPRSGRNAAAPGAPAEPVGVMLAESFDASSATANQTQIEAFASHVALALSHAQQWERARTPLYRLMHRLGGPGGTRMRRRTAMTWCLLAATIAAIGMTPVPYRVETAGQLLPVQRRWLFAPLDARVSHVLVTGNDNVAQGQVLLRLENDRLAADVLSTRHQLQERTTLLETLEAQRSAAQNRGLTSDVIRLTGAVAQTQIEISDLEFRLQSLESELDELDVRSPMAGLVTTFAPNQSLLGRPVRRGEKLLEIMDTRGSWELVVDLPAHRVRNVLSAQAESGAASLRVEFSLVTEPERVHEGTLRTKPSRIVVDAKGDLMAPLEIDVTAQDIDHPVAGADVVAYVACGKRALAWVLFGDFVDYVRRRIW